MYCPNCTTEISTGQRYCRSCGVDLQEVSLALGGPRHIEGSGTVEETNLSGGLVRVSNFGVSPSILGFSAPWS